MTCRWSRIEGGTRRSAISALRWERRRCRCSAKVRVRFIEIYDASRVPSLRAGDSLGRVRSFETGFRIAHVAKTGPSGARLHSRLTSRRTHGARLSFAGVMRETDALHADRAFLHDAARAADTSGLSRVERARPLGLNQVKYRTVWAVVRAEASPDAALTLRVKAVRGVVRRVDGNTGCRRGVALLALNGMKRARCRNLPYSSARRESCAFGRSPPLGPTIGSWYRLARHHAGVNSRAAVQATVIPRGIRSS